MSDLTIQFEGGDVLANLEERTITGLLIPYGEIGRTNVGRFMVEAGGVELPTDPSVISLNLDHDRTQNVGRAVRVWEEPRGVMATYSIANTPEGDAALADALNPNGKRRKQSGEFGPAIIKAGKLVAGHAKLWGSALVEAGAFPSAQVLAADTPDDELPDDITEHPSIELPELPDDITVTTPGGASAVYEPAAAPAEEPNTEGESNVTATATAAGAPATTPAGHVAAGTVPATARTAAPNVPAATTTARPVDLAQVFASIAEVKSNPYAEGAVQVLAALTDVKLTGATGLPTGAGLQPNWLGELEQGIPYVREYITLMNLGTNITAGGKKGFKVKRGTSAAPIDGPAAIPNGGTWAGDKAEINSYNGFTLAAASTLQRFAVGNDIAREFYDLPGGSEFVEAFLRLIIEDHLYWSDTKALATIVSTAGAPVAANTAAYPAAYPLALGQLIQGILAVKKKKADGRRDVPTFAIANDKAYEQLVYAAGGEEHLPAFVNIAMSTNSTGTVDGNVQVVQGDTGIANTASVIVGSSKAIEFDEIAGGPLKIDALDLARGGIDKAVHGYLQTFIVRPEAIVKIGTAD